MIIYGTPTPVYANVYPYTQTGMENGGPFKIDGRDTEVTCPTQSNLPTNWQINSTCSKQYWITLSLDDGKEPTLWPVSETQYLAVMNGNVISVMLNGYGDIAEVSLP